jgi:hypothetical protein
MFLGNVHAVTRQSPAPDADLIVVLTPNQMADTMLVAAFRAMGFRVVASEALPLGGDTALPQAPET